jgi:hypothetical protein
MAFLTSVAMRAAAVVVLPVLSARASKNSNEVSAYNVAACCARTGSLLPDPFLLS